MDSAKEVDDDVDSEEEDEIPCLLMDKEGYPILPTLSHMSLDKQKVIVHEFIQGTYHKSFYSMMLRYIVYYIFR